jgi:hypothetical protein
LGAIGEGASDVNVPDRELLQCNVARTLRNLLFSFGTEASPVEVDSSEEKAKAKASDPPVDPRKEKEGYIEKLVSIGFVTGLLWLCEHCEDDHALADATATLAELATSRSAAKLVQQVRTEIRTRLRPSLI